MSAERTVLVYGAGGNQVPVIAAARRRGFRVVAVDRDPHAPGIPHASRFVCTSLRDHDGIRAAIAGETVCAVVARVTDPLALASARRMACDRGLAGPDERLLAAATSKRAFERLCHAAGLTTPRRFGVEEAREALAHGTSSSVTRGPHLRICVRPDVTIRGKAAIRRVDSPSGLALACEDAAAASENRQVDLSQWIDGSDVSVLAALEGGRARRIALYEEWIAVAPSGQIEGIGVGMPSRFEAAAAVIDESLAALARACPESRSLVMLSLRIDERGRAHAIEIHLGLGGDAIADRLLPAALPGFDAFEAWVAFSAGEAIDGPIAAPRARGLLRASEPESQAGWTLVEASDGAGLRALARERLLQGWECPIALEDDVRGVDDRTTGLRTSSRGPTAVAATLA